MDKTRSVLPALQGIARVVAAALVCIALAGCAHSVKTQVSRELARVEPDLKRGVSTRADVLTLLGQPDGRGAAALVNESWQADIWYYESSSISVTSVGNQKILAVFFKGDLFNGYFWFSNDIDVHY